jgi:hypothetical protein
VIKLQKTTTFFKNMQKAPKMNTGSVQHVSIEELRENPKIIMNILESTNFSLLMTREEGKEITLYQRISRPENLQIIQEAEALAKQRRKAGETSQDAFQKFTQIHDDISKKQQTPAQRAYALLEQIPKSHTLPGEKSTTELLREIRDQE